MPQPHKRALSWLLTIAAVGAAVVHALFPSIAIDATTALLLAFAAIPWLGSLFRSIELPGGATVESQHLKVAEAKARETGLINGNTPSSLKTLSKTISPKKP